MIGCFGNGHGPCAGRIDRHHVIPKGRIKAALKTKAYRQGWSKRQLAEAIRVAVEDERVIAPACRRHHELWHNARYRVPRSALPLEVEQFAKDYGLMSSLDRDYEQEAA